MKPDPRFAAQPLEFWAHVKSISQQLGYTDKATKQIKVHSIPNMVSALQKLGLQTQHLTDTALGAELEAYFLHRAIVLNEQVQHDLMNKIQAEAVFLELRERLKPTCALPMNKQKGDKQNHAFLTGIVNMLLESALSGRSIDYDPKSLVTITRNGMPYRTLSRRFDGCFPSTVNPRAVWEIKEYYYTTTFGSRVADGVYETLLDGLELQELWGSAGVHVEHYLFIDDHFTWWQCGKSYLCRMVDMMHMGLLNEAIFGREAVTRVPAIARGWLEGAK